MNISELGESKFLTKEECDPPIRVTITGIKRENLAKENEPQKMKFVLTFLECKPLVLNKTNGGRIAHVLGSDESDDWINKQIDLWNDPSVEFGGQLIGGVRVLVPQPTVSAPQAPQQAGQSEAAPMGGLDQITDQHG